MTGWKHGEPYSLPIKPSPNLPNDQSIRLYASLCPFEATHISVGRGTTFPFQVLGAPNKKIWQFRFHSSFPARIRQESITSRNSLLRRRLTEQREY